MLSKRPEIFIAFYFAVFLATEGCAPRAGSSIKWVEKLTCHCNCRGQNPIFTNRDERKVNATSAVPKDWGIIMLELNLDPSIMLE